MPAPPHIPAPRHGTLFEQKTRWTCLTSRVSSGSSTMPSSPTRTSRRGCRCWWEAAAQLPAPFEIARDPGAHDTPACGSAAAAGARGPGRRRRAGLRPAGKLGAVPFAARRQREGGSLHSRHRQAARLEMVHRHTDAAPPDCALTTGRVRSARSRPAYSCMRTRAPAAPVPPPATSARRPHPPGGVLSHQ
jgi:hypothetical protein